MAKCTKCGADLVEGAVFCGNCGASVETESQQASANEAQDLGKAAMEKGKEIASKGLDAVENNKYVQDLNSKLEGKTGIKNTGLYVAVGAGIVAVIAIVFIVVNLLGGGYKKVATGQFDMMNKRSTDYEKSMILKNGKTMAKYQMEVEKLTRELLDDDGDTAAEMFEESQEKIYDNLEDEYGKNWKIKYKVDSVKKLSKSKVEDAQEEWEDTLEYMEELIESMEDTDEYAEDNDLDEDVVEDLYKCHKKWYKKLKKMKVKKIYKVKLKDVKIKGKDDEDKYGEGKFTIQVAKVGSDWMIVDSDISMSDLDLDDLSDMADDAADMLDDLDDLY